MEFLDFPSMSCELRGAMSNGHLKLTDEKIVFQHAKSGKKDSVKVSTGNVTLLFCDIGLLMVILTFIV